MSKLKRSSCLIVVSFVLLFVLNGGVRADAALVPTGAEVPLVSADRSAVTLERPSPSWLTADLRERAAAAGPKGIWVDPAKRYHEPTAIDCQGTDPVGREGVISAGGCMIHPNVCTMNFIFVSNNENYIGTAGHCAEKTGEDVFMQIGTRVSLGLVNIAKVGTVSKTTGDGGIGNDFAIVKIDPGFRVDPSLPIVGGPKGVFCGDEVGQALTHYGHGYHFTGQQGYPRAGVGSPDLPVRGLSGGYTWAGQAFGGDSGSGVVQAGGRQAIGNLTHGLGVLVVPIPGQVFGTPMAKIMNYLGSNFSLMNADKTTSPGCGGTSGGGGGSTTPTASFTYGCGGTTTCTFDGSGSTDDGSITTYSWSFGDGATATGAKVTHTYSNAQASYNVVLTVTDNAGNTDSEQKTVSCSSKGKNFKCA